MRLTILAAAALLTFATPATAQTAGPSPAVTPTPAADPADVASPEALVAALYGVISGDKGVPRDWDRFRSLFHSTGRLMPTGRDSSGVGATRAMTPDDYITRNGAYLVAEGFHEREIAQRTERYGRIAHVFSTYEGLHSLSDPQPFARGINSIQLFNDGARWWVISIYWHSETADTPIPPAYLPEATPPPLTEAG